MAFRSAARIVYSTCSVAAAENEAVVVAALASAEGTQGGWTLLERAAQPEGLRKWERRGDAPACQSALLALHGQSGAGARRMPSTEELADCCVRCEKGGPSGTIGFFVAGFVKGRRIEQLQERDGRQLEQDEDEWNGFSD
jgi:putative methyltransferase